MQQVTRSRSTDAEVAAEEINYSSQITTKSKSGSEPIHFMSTEGCIGWRIVADTYGG